MSTTTAQRQDCPRCHATFDEPSRFCRQCGADLTRTSTVQPARRDPTSDPTEPLEAVVDRRLSDSNQAWLGKIVDGRYRVIEVLGRGGMGVVYRVEHLRMGKMAAMKVLHRDLAQDPEVVERFEREAAAVSKLHHPHTVQVFDFGNAGGNLYLIMELVRGLDMGRVIDRDGAMAWSRAAPLFIQVCGALQEAHELGIVHRDLKPENILITRTTAGRDYAKVLDFGLAKLDQRGAAGDHTDKQQIVGTPYFMAPEQIRGEAVDARTDIYSLGALMFEVLTATHLYTSSTAVGVLTKHLTGEPEAPSLRAPQMDIPPEVDELCRKALAKDPAQRWASAAELAAAIEEVYRATVSDAIGTRSSSSRGLRGSTLSIDEEQFESDLRLRRSDLDAFERGLKRRRASVFAGATMLGLAAAGGVAWVVTRPAPLHHSEVEPNNDPQAATRVAPGEVTGFLGKRMSSTEGDRDYFRVMWPAGSRRVATVRVMPPPNIDVSLVIDDGFHAATVDEGGLGEPEILHRRTINGPVMVTIAQVMGDQRFPVENVSDPYTLTVGEEPAGGEAEPNGTEPDATLLELTREVTGYLDTRQDIDLVRWTGEAGTYTVEVRADGIPLSWRLPDGKPRTPGAAKVTLGKGDVLRLERTDKAGKGSLPGRDVKWSIVVRN